MWPVPDSGWALSTIGAVIGAMVHNRRTTGGEEGVDGVTGWRRGEGELEAGGDRQQCVRQGQS